MPIVLQKIESYGWTPARVNTFYEYKEAIRFLGITWRKAGIYTRTPGLVQRLPDNPKPGLDIDKCDFIKDNMVWDRPKLLIHMASGEVVKRVYHTEEEAKAACDKVSELITNSFTGGPPVVWLDKLGGF
jgi:hypothetical protein